MSKHTPGPWQWMMWNGHFRELRGPNGVAIVFPQVDVDADNRLAVHVIVAGDNPGDEYLIAAAPDLLTACREALHWMGQDSRGEEDCVNLLRAAIAKAEGRNA